MKNLTKFYSLCYHNCYHDCSNFLIFLDTDFILKGLFVLGSFREKKEDAGVFGR